MKPRTVIAIDIGYGNTKVVWSHSLDKQGRSRWGEICFRSITPNVVVNEESAGLASQPDRILVEHNGQAYYAGPAATMGVEARFLDPNYIETDQHEVLLRASIHLAMRELGHFSNTIDLIVVGLPVSGFTNRGRRLHEIAMQARPIPIPKHLVHTTSGASSIEVKALQCLVLPQPFGGLRAAGQNASADDPIYQTGKLTMLIDPGYRTLDWFVSNGMSPELKLSGSFDGGVSNILRTVSQQVGFDHGTGSLEFDQVEEGLSSGKINLGFKVIDMAPYQKLAVDAAKREIAAFLGRIDMNKARLSRVLLAGGGAKLYEKALKDRLPGYTIECMSDSVMSNARGYWLAGCDQLAST